MGQHTWATVMKSKGALAGLSSLELQVWACFYFFKRDE